MAKSPPDTQALGLKIQAEDHKFRRMMQAHRRETTSDPGEELGRMHALKPLSRVVARGRSQVRRVTKGKR